VSTYVDGATPSVSPDPDDETGPVAESSPGSESGAHWVQAEIQRRMAENRSTRGRHARRGEAPVSADLGVTGHALPVDRPRHSVQSPGPAATPVGIPPDDPSPGGLPVRRRRGGPGKPLHADGPPVAGPWTRPGAHVPKDVNGTVDATPADAGLADAASTGAAPTDTAPADAPEAVAAASADRVSEDAGLTTAAPAPEPAAVETTDEIVDPPTAPHPIVLARRVPASRRQTGPAARRLEPARLAAARPPTLRNVPVVGTSPAEPGSTRVRVVLSERKGVAHAVRTIKEVQEGTGVGDLLRRDLIRSQLSVTLRFAALAVLVLAALPIVFAVMPEVGRFQVLGLRLPWLLLGVLIYPFLVGVAWWYTHVADRVEQNFADHVQE
jgi:hypothetical protein